MSPNYTDNDDPTQIQKFYKGAGVFITGATGFLGKILLEKLLRSCPDLASIYVLVRNKKGKNLQTRIDELFEDTIFDRIKEECPKFRHKIVGVGGDCSLPGLGLTLQDTQLLIHELIKETANRAVVLHFTRVIVASIREFMREWNTITYIQSRFHAGMDFTILIGFCCDWHNYCVVMLPWDYSNLKLRVSVVFHVAATVRFDEKLKMAVAINVRAPQDMLMLASQMPRLKAFMHVSTAYSNVPNWTIEERFYQSPVDSKKLVMLMDSMSEKIIDNITPMVLDKWPNTYTYTKAVAEDLIRQDGRNLPVGVFRPAVVVSTYREPIKAWINNLYGPTGVCAGAGTGVLRTLHCDPEVNANIVPVDMCVNALIAAAWEVGETFQKHKDNSKINNYEIPVYNYESSNDMPITWGKFMDLSQHYGVNTPSIKAIWYYYLTLQKSLTLYILSTIFLHYLPAIFVDAALLCAGKSPKMFKIYKKIHKFTAVISYFCTRNWTFKSERVRALVAKMSPRDQEVFFCDLKRLDWNEFFTTYLRGIRVYLIQDPLDTLPEAKIKWQRLFWIHQIVKAVAYYLTLRILWWMLKIVYQTFIC